MTDLGVVKRMMATEAALALRRIAAGITGGGSKWSEEVERWKQGEDDSLCMTYLEALKALG